MPYALVDLAESAGVSPRTIRYYQATGLLQAPERAGRNAVYSEEHRERLRHIADLQARGLKLAAIRDMVSAPASGEAPVVALLGPEYAGERWLAESSATMTAVEVAELLGERNLGLLTELQDHGYLTQVHTDDGQRWRVDDLPLLRGALQLADLGTEISLSASGRDLMREQIRALAEDLVHMWASEAGERFEGEPSAEELTPLVDRVRSVVWQSAAHIMAQEIEAAMERVEQLTGETVGSDDA